MPQDQLEQLTSRCVESGQGCTRAEADALLDYDEADLFASATAVRQTHFGNTVRLCTIINARSGSCDMNCAFCPQSAHHDGSGETFPLVSSAPSSQSLRELLRHPPWLHQQPPLPE